MSVIKYVHKNTGTCSRSVTVTLDGDIIQKIVFDNGCDGNLKAVAKLCEGLTADHAVELLSGIRCGQKKTSCPDQLARALKQIKINRESNQK